MAARRRQRTDTAPANRGLVRKRPRREGEKRSMSLRLCSQHADRLDVMAAKGRTTPAEIVMDALEVHFGWRRSAAGDGPVEPNGGGE